MIAISYVRKGLMAAQLLSHHLNMRIAQVAPLYESVPPKFYGGTERVVSYLTEELVRQGHEVTLFASGDSVTAARLISGSTRSLRLDPGCRDPIAHHVRLMELVARRADDFDIIHFHIDYLHFPVSKRIATPSITTLHGRLNFPDLVPLYREYRDVPVISISDSQRAPLPWLNWQATIHHGLPEDLYRFQDSTDDYLAFVGRISPEKRADRAIEIARRTGIKLRIAAKVDRTDQEYFETVIQPLLSDPIVEFVGEIGEREKSNFFGNARALLFPIDWPEPFGLVMIEAMACGTPVIAYRNGSVGEIIEPGVNGFIVEDMDSAVEAVGRIASVNRRRCRQHFEQKFSVRRMAEDYVKVFQRLAGASVKNRSSISAA